MRWFILFLGSLATFRLSHLIAKERGPLAVLSVFVMQCLPDAARLRSGSAAFSVSLFLQARLFA